MSVLPAVWVLGDVTTDIALRVTTFPGEGRDEFAGEAKTGVGGTGANMSLVLTRLGFRPLLIACLGDDAWGGSARATLAEQGVDTALLRIVAGVSTHLVVVVVSASGERTMIGHRGASGLGGPAPACDDPADRPAALLVSGYALLGAQPFARARQTMENAAGAGVPVVLDLPSHPPPEVYRGVHDLIRGVDVLIAGEHEYEALAIDADHLITVVTLGSGGCVAKTPHASDEWLRVPAVPVDAHDTTGAGDAFAAAFTAAWISGRPVVDALTFANRIGAAATLRMGAGVGLLDLNDLGIRTIF